VRPIYFFYTDIGVVDYSKTFSQKARDKKPEIKPVEPDPDNAGVGIP
jgi:hypothetical protein